MTSDPVELWHVDKRSWGDGPWSDEPDEVSWTDRRTGIFCLLGRAITGAWCGYCRLPDGHPWAALARSEIPVIVHGGLTFKGEGDGNTTLPEGVYIGFDCAGTHDRKPAFEAVTVEAYAELGAAPPDFYRSLRLGETYRPLSYARSNVLILAVQIVEAGDAEGTKE